MSKDSGIAALHGIALRLKSLAKEKEDVRRKLAVTAKKLRQKAKQLAATAKEKEVVRRTLVVTAKKLKVTAEEKEMVRRKLVVTAENLRLKAKQLAATAEEKEDVRRKLVVTAEKLNLSHETLERKVLERTKDLARVKAKDEAILASIGDGLVATDKNGRILLVNKTFENLLGWKEADARGKHLSEVLPMVDSNGNPIPESERLVTKTLKESAKSTSASTIYYKRKDGSTFPVAITVAPTFLGKELIGAVKVFRDITKEKEIEKARSEFMSIASHQLRTPLTAIRWVLSSLKRENLPPDLMSLIATAHETSTHMAVTVKRMLMISHLEEDGMHPEIAEVNVCTILKKIARLHNEHRERNGLELVIHCSDDLVLQTDEQLLIEILDNLVSNAYKYTPRGGKITVTARKEGAKLRIDVADTGYGIPQDEQQKIPKKFFRASNIASPAPAGTGIGLYMVYNIVGLIGGNISFVSKENAGTTFSLLLPS